MTIRNVLLHASAENVVPDRGAAAWAIGIAARFDAHLTALVHQLDVVLPRSAHGGEIETDSAADNESAPATRAAQLEAAAARADIRAEVITRRSFAYGIPEIAAERARLHDLVVSGVDQTGLLSERSVAEHLLFEAGRPLVVVPQDHATPFKCERIVIAWDWSRAAARALGDAMPLLRAASDVRILTFGDDKQFDTSLDEDVFIDSLRHRGVSGRFEVATRGGRPVGQALCEEALERDADLLVMGGYGHSRLRQFILGGATRATLDGPGLPTLLSH